MACHSSSDFWTLGGWDMLAEAEELKNANAKLKLIERAVVVAEVEDNRVRAV